MPIQKNESTERLGLRRCTDASLDSQMREKRVDLIRSHGCRMTFSMEEDETLRPRDVRLFRAAAVVPRPHSGANAIKKTRRFCHCPRLPRQRVVCQISLRGVDGHHPRMYANISGPTIDA